MTDSTLPEPVKLGDRVTYDVPAERVARATLTRSETGNLQATCSTSSTPPTGAPRPTTRSPCSSSPRRARTSRWGTTSMGSSAPTAWTR